MKCFYCDFTAFAGQRAQVSRYLKAIGRETVLRFGPKVHTLYVGGGTPSELSAEETGELFRILRGPYGPFEELKEITFEANPESLTPDKLDVLARSRVTRISLGLQTMEPRLLKEIGRRHTVDDFLTVYREVRKRGVAVNVDLMYALPRQSLREALDSLEAVVRLEPDHISLYGLQVEDRTLFGKREVEIDEDLAREMFERSLDRLAAAGFHHYEISNFARPGYESVHNQIYWRDGEYVGLGCGASGFLGGVRYTNKDRLNDYCAALEPVVKREHGRVTERVGERTEGWTTGSGRTTKQGRGGEGLAVAEQEFLSGREKLGETIWLGLRLLDGLDMTPEMPVSFPEEFRHAQEQGWLRIKGNVVRLTREGIFLANRVFEEFVPPFRSSVR